MPSDRRQNKGSQQRRCPPYFHSIQATPSGGPSSVSQPTPGARHPGLLLEGHTLSQGPHHAHDPSLPRLCGLPAIRVKMVNHPLVNEDAVVYSSPNAPSLPTVLPSYPPVPCDDIRTLAYRDNHNFYLAFIPQCMHLSGGLLHHINYNRSNLPVEERNAKFYLAESLASEWVRLESQLVAVGNLMTQIVGLMPPKDFVVPEPKNYGYTLSFATRLDALNAIWLSLEAFVALSACISFLIALCKQRYPPDTFWSIGLSELSPEVKGKNGVSRKVIDATLIESLKQTPFFSDHKLVPRVGALIDVSYDLEWHKYIPAFVMAHVPIWFRFGPYSNYMQQCSTKIYHKSLFDKAELDVIVESTKYDLLNGIQSRMCDDYSALHNEAFAPNFSHSESTALSNTVTDAPLPFRGSGQKQGQTWEEFFKERDMKNKEKWEKASDADKKCWTSLQEAHDGKEQKPPGTSSESPTTYIWVTIHDEKEGGFLHRKLLYKKEVIDVWYHHHRDERIYDPISNTWDICKPAGGGKLGDQHEDTDGAEKILHIEPSGLDIDDPRVHHMPYVLPPPSPGERFDVQTTISPPTAEVTDARPLGSTPRTQDLPPGWHQTYDSLENILRDRYSFVHQEHPIQDTFLTSQQVCAQIFVHNECAGDEFPPFLRDPFRQFTDALCRGSPLNDVPFYALNPIYRSSFTTHLRSISNDMFYIHPQLYNTALGGRQGYGYIIKATDPKASPGWELSVDNPLAALQIIRSNWGPSLCDVAIALVSRGIPFNTFLRDPTLQYNYQYRQKWHELAPTPIHTPPGVIFARLNTFECYQSYVEARDEFLRDTRHIRAALLLGGIVWRLAIDILEPGIVLEGPSEFFELTGKPYLLGEDEVWDDTLSESETDFICGVFKVPKLDGKPGLFVTSWWPRQCIWHKGRLDVGYWTPQCETWFQMRRKAILDRDPQGKGQLRTIPQWNSALSFQKGTKKLRDRTQEEAERFIIQTNTGL